MNEKEQAFMVMLKRHKIVALGMLFMPPLLYSQGNSAMLCWFTGISILLALFYDIWHYRTLHIGHILDESLLQAQSVCNAIVSWRIRDYSTLHSLG